MSIPHPRFHAQRDAGKPALILADTGDAICYGELVERADRAAQLFRSLGLEQGDTIALFLENHIRYPELIWAAKNSGITYACISSQASADDAAYIVENSDAKLLISSNRLSATAVQVVARCGDRLTNLMLDHAIAPFRSYEALLQDQPALPLEGRCRGPSMLYSSGTTGRPKGVRTKLSDEPPETPPRRHTMLTQQYGFDERTVLMNPGPFYHAAPGRFMVSILRSGGTVIGFRKFDAEAVLSAVERFRATHGLFVPTMFIRMLKLDDETRKRHDLSSLRCAIHLGAPCPIVVKERMIDWLGPVIEELYAGTESVGHTFISSAEWLSHKGSVGRPAAGCTIRVVDEAGQEVAAGVSGLITMRNGNRFEYHKDAEKTRSAIDGEGWGSLDDIGHVDAEGYLYLDDRQSHMIISGGVNIYPQEAENLLSTHPDVADIAVIGIPHSEFGEEVKAVVQPSVWPVADAAALATRLIDHCRATLSPIKCPRSIDFVAVLPRNESGKLLKRLIRAPFWEGRDSSIV